DSSPLHGSILALVTVGFSVSIAPYQRTVHTKESAAQNEQPDNEQDESHQSKKLSQASAVPERVARIASRTFIAMLMCESVMHVDLASDRAEGRQRVWFMIFPAVATTLAGSRVSGPPKRIVHARANLAD